jgi:DeoR family transcriptional regulator, aga operon transcriptional repressor
MAGQTALNFLNDVYLDRVFLGVTGFDLKRGVTTLEAEEAAVARAMARHGKQVIVVADSSKINVVSPALICPLSEIHVLVTDSGIPPDVEAALQTNGIVVLKV